MSIFINGNPASGLPASYPSNRVTYDNTSSGLTADDVQGAIDELASGGSGGHTIENPSGTDMTQRANLQFVDAGVGDDSVNDRTKVEVVTELLNETAFDNLATDGTADGIYAFPDSGTEYLTADNIAYDANNSVAEAISGINEELANIFKIVTVANSEGASVSSGMFDVSIAFTVPDGYSVVGIVGYQIGRFDGIYYSIMRAVSGSVRIAGYNSGAATTVAMTVFVLCVKSGHI